MTAEEAREERRFEESVVRPPLTPDEQVELLARCQQGDIEARNKLVQSVAAFVIGFAKRYRKRAGDRYIDMLHDTYCRLLEVIHRWDPAKGSLTLYVKLWARSAIQRFLPSTDPAVEYHYGDKWSEGAFKNSVTLDVVAGSRADGDTYLDLLESPAALPEELASQSETRRHVRSVMRSTLTAIEQRVLHAIWIENPRGRKLDEISGDFDVGRERIRQIQRHAMHRMLREFLRRIRNSDEPTSYFE